MWKNGILFLAACVVSVASAEGVVRIVFDSSNNLMVDRIPDPALGSRIPAGTNGHDANGFRNPGIPETADILAVGDSMTYGVMAPSTESWPAHLAEITGESVYNAGPGGFGPLQYLHLVRMLAPQLKPKTIVVMLYVGNDAGDAIKLAYSLEHWKDYRDPARTHPPPLRDSGGVKRSLYRLLAKNSVLYNLLKALLKLPHKSKLLQELRAVTLGSNAISLTHLDHRFFLTPDWIGNHPEGLAIAKRALWEIDAFCAELNIRLHIAIMPLRQRVFYPHIKDQLTEPQKERTLSNMRKSQNIISDLTGFLSAEEIAYTDLTVPMIAALEKRIIYPGSDPHPNGEGYRVVAQTLAKAID